MKAVKTKIMLNLKKKSDKLLNTISITGIYFLHPASLQKLVLSIWVFSMDGHHLYLIVPFWYALQHNSGEFGQTMVRVLTRCSRAKLPMARPNEPDMLPKCIKKVRLGIYRTQIQPKI